MLGNNDQAQRFVGTDLGPKCLHNVISRRLKSPLARKRLKVENSSKKGQTVTQS